MRISNDIRIRKISAVASNMNSPIVPQTRIEREAEPPQLIDHGLILAFRSSGSQDRPRSKTAVRHGPINCLGSRKPISLENSLLSGSCA
jgi:hypothetical protein